MPGGRVLGGAPLNFAYHAGALGAEASVLSAVGRDALGDEAVEGIKALGVKPWVERVPYPTGTVEVSVDTEGVPAYAFPPEAAWDHIATAPFEEEARKADAVCFGTLALRSAVSRRAVLDLLERLPRNVLKAYDVNLRENFYSRELVEALLNVCDLLKMNEEELEVLSGFFSLEGDPVRRCEELAARYGLKAVLLTRGTRGSYLLASSVRSFLPTPRVRVGDTVGAGDAFTAAVIAGLLEKRSWKEVHRRAVALAAYVSTRHGATPVHDPDRIGMLLGSLPD